ncbi:MAG: Oxygen regulatory protein NreC [Anaerolineae bacterium]|nr:Oxygen regulatory protein NreC [Anaerolineae bacterium]
MIKIIVAEDHHLVREGILSLLEKAEDIEIIAEAEDGEEAVQLVQQHRPDVLLTDIGMPRLNGIQAAEKIRDMGLETRVVILSMHSNKSLIRQSMRSGAKGYVLKSGIKDELLMALRAAARNGTYLSPEVSELLMADFGTPAAEGQDGFDLLNPREREILKLISEGHTNKSIADLMHLSVKTIEKDRTSLLEKLQVRDLASLIRLAMKHGLIFDED